MRRNRIRRAWKGDQHYRARIRSTFNRHRAPMIANNLADNRQAQPRSVRLARADKRVKHSTPYILGNSGALVSYANFEALLARLNIDSDPAVRIRGSFTGV